MSSSSSSGSRSMFKPRSVGARWVLLFVVLYFVWLTVTHPAEAIETFKAIVSIVVQLFTTVFNATQEAGT